MTALASQDPIEAFALAAARSFDAGSSVRLGGIQRFGDGRASFPVEGTISGRHFGFDVVVPPRAVALGAFLTWCMAVERAGRAIVRDAA